MSENTMSRRTFVAASAVAAVAAGTAGVAFADEAALADGTYTATGKGVGTVTVTLTVADGSIAEASVDVSGETPWVGGVLAEPLAASIVEHGDGIVDVIAGATMTCNGAMAAAGRCLAQARGEEPAPEMTAWDTATEADWLGT